MSGQYRRDIRWLAAQDDYADPHWNLDPDIALRRRVHAARVMHQVEKQYAAAHPA